ncbi:hypothetical protein CC86DRAFT_436180 [Ophiobolus disseminans]|uniref:Uncharacterized protein n=1 Tax=Ophiobolus disseminans TaxID=1469910 RepID=A0A6A7ABX3_9PLEO|nr:hypothetical protein CC86DRAFT_436180 [Ophiobolus disseminans]
MLCCISVAHKAVVSQLCPFATPLSSNLHTFVHHPETLKNRFPTLIKVPSYYCTSTPVDHLTRKQYSTHLIFSSGAIAYHYNYFIASSPTMLQFVLLSAFIFAHAQAQVTTPVITGSVSWLTLKPTLDCSGGQVGTSVAGIVQGSAVMFYACVKSGQPPTAMTPGTIITPGVGPSNTPGVLPGATPSVVGSNAPSVNPSATPGVNPSATPGVNPSATPGVNPSNTPGVVPSGASQATAASPSPNNSPAPSPAQSNLPAASSQIQSNLPASQAVPSSVVPAPSVQPSSVVLPTLTLSAAASSSAAPSSAVPSSSAAPSSPIPSSTIPSSTIPSSTIPSSTIPSSTIPSSTIPSSTIPPSTIPSSSTSPPPEPSKKPDEPKPDDKPKARVYALEAEPGDVWMCNNINFDHEHGKCVYFREVTNKCFNLPSDMAGQISSIRPDKGQLCRFFENTDCGGKADWIRWPGTKNMRGRRFDNRVRSWNCASDDCNGGDLKPGGCHEHGDGTPKPQGKRWVGEPKKGARRWLSEKGWEGSGYESLGEMTDGDRFGI